MKTESKLALVRGAVRRIPLGVVETARRLIESTTERSPACPLRDIDRWSDQAEVAFVEALNDRRA